MRNLPSALLFVLVATLYIPSICAQDQSASPSLSQLAKLTGTDSVSGDQFGFSVAISGNVVVVGAPYAQSGSNQSVGAAYVFVKPASGWANMTQIAKLTPSDGYANLRFGWSVAIAGNTIVVGVNDINGAGSAYVFVMPAGGWKNKNETAKLSLSSQSSSVSISGNVIVVGSASASPKYSSQGAAYVFVKPQKGWSTTSTYAAELTASDAATSGGAELGISVSISGNTVVTGARDAIVGSNAAQGAAYVFVKPSSGWRTATQNAKLTASDGQYEDMFGSAVAVNGSTVTVGSPNRFSGITVGAAYVFIKPSNGWHNATQTAEFTSGMCGLGFSVATTATQVVAGDTTGDCGGQDGSTYTFTKPASGWKTTSQYTNQLSAADGFNDDEFGNSVAIYGTTIVVGSPRFPASVGAAYVF